VTVEDSLRLRARSARASFATLRGSRLIELLRSIPFRQRDRFCDELLGIGLPPPDMPLPRGSVPYLPCGVDEILTMVLEAPVSADDEVVDLGSGLGRVVMLAHLLSGARGRGIEIQDHLVHKARAHCAELALRDVMFVHANAAETELDGSIFFLYAPCNGDMLTRLLARLHAVAQRRPIIIAAVGLDFEVGWLRARKTSSVALTLYESHHA
jgi:hypothetical protein